MFASHLKTNSKKPIVIAIMAVLTTSALLACTPSRQQEQSNNEVRPLPADKNLPAEISSAEAPAMAEPVSTSSAVIQDENSSLEADTKQQASDSLLAEQESTLILTADA